LHKRYRQDLLEFVAKAAEGASFTLASSEEAPKLHRLLRRKRMRNTFSHGALSGEEQEQEKSNANDLLLPVRPASFQVLPSTPVKDVHMLFITLHLPAVIVSSRGRLVGMISREKLKKALGDRHHFVFIRNSCKQLLKRCFD